MPRPDARALLVLKVILIGGVLSTITHYSHNFVAVSDYPGPHGVMDTITRVGVLVTWPLLTAVGIRGYRRFAEGRYREAQYMLIAYSFVGLATLGHFAYGDPQIPTPFYLTIFTDAFFGACALGFGLYAGSRAARPPVTGGSASSAGA